MTLSLQGLRKSELLTLSDGDGIRGHNIIMQSHMETGRDPTLAKVNILCFSALTDVGYGALNLKLMLSND